MMMMMMMIIIIIINGRLLLNVKCTVTIPDHVTTSTYGFLVNCSRNVNKPNKEHKIKVLADNHAQGCAMRVKDDLNDGFEVSAYVKPGKSTDILVETATSEINN
jgi:signal transduction histidine kinase